MRTSDTRLVNTNSGRKGGGREGGEGGREGRREGGEGGGEGGREGEGVLKGGRREINGENSRERLYSDQPAHVACLGTWKK